MQQSEHPALLFGDLFGPAARANAQMGRKLVPDVDTSVTKLEFTGINAAAEAEAARMHAEAEAEIEVTASPTPPDRALQMRVMIDAAREESALETRIEMKLQMDALVLLERQRLIEVCEQFARDRQRYFSLAEEQVVRLALAVAARVLHHESMADPLALKDAIRAALGRLQEGSASTLRVPREELVIWSEVFPEGSEQTVRVSADDRMRAGELALETVVGRVDVGIAVQLEEITRGFAELVDPNPGSEMRDEMEKSQ